MLRSLGYITQLLSKRGARFQENRYTAFNTYVSPEPIRISLPRDFDHAKESGSLRYRAGDDIDNTRALLSRVVASLISNLTSSCSRVSRRICQATKGAEANSSSDLQRAPGLCPIYTSVDALDISIGHSLSFDTESYVDVGVGCLTGLAARYAVQTPHMVEAVVYAGGICCHRSTAPEYSRSGIIHK